MTEQRVTRRLAAILAADVVGYSRLMEADETGTLADLKARQREVLEPLVAKHQGRVFKTTGDGVLVEFASAVNAVQCAVELQQAMAAANEGQPADRGVVFRIGINLGDVMVEDGDLFGDGVNIAARLEALAEPGGILISGAAHEQIKGKLRHGFDDVGAQTLKNISEPVRAFRVTGMPTSVATSLRSIADKPSIAVLPFTNMSGDPEQKYFSDGVTEDIITELSRFHSLLVIARNSSFQYRDKEIDVKRVGRELGVQFVVEGSVRRAGGRIRVTAQLVSAETGNHLWAERYDRELEDVFAVQEAIAQSVAATVRGRVESAGHDRAMRLKPAELKAYDLVLRAKNLILRFNRTDNAQARLLAETAVELDPGNAQAYATLSHAAFIDYMAWWATDRDGAFKRMYDAARRAVMLDDSDSVTRSRLGIVYLFRREYDEARSELEKAIDLNPSDSVARGMYALFLTCIGNPDAALAQFSLAKRQDPYEPSWAPWVRGVAHFIARRYEDAILEFKKVRDSINEVRGWLAACYAQIGQMDEARASLEEFLGQAERDMVGFPGRHLKDWEAYWHGAMEFRDQKEFHHLFAALRKAGFPE